MNAKDLNKKLQPVRAEGFKTVSARVSKAPWTANGDFLLRVKFRKPIDEARLAELVAADEDGLLFDCIDQEIDLCDNATDQEAKRLVVSLGLPQEDAWPYEWGFHDYTVDKASLAICVESVWSFNAP